MTGSDASEEVDAGFPRPPAIFDDREGRRIAIRTLGDGPVGPRPEREALVEMYASFDPADRAQGIPPTGEPAVREWVDDLLEADAVHVLAWHDDHVAGHATLVADGEGGYELAIFVHQSHQRAGIGTRLIRCLLGEGAARGIEQVWLTVERWNQVAVDLYEAVGFETTGVESFELEMAIDLGAATG